MGGSSTAIFLGIWLLTFRVQTLLIDFLRQCSSHCPWAVPPDPHFPLAAECFLSHHSVSTVMCSGITTASLPSSVSTGQTPYAPCHSTMKISKWCPSCCQLRHPAGMSRGHGKAGLCPPQLCTLPLAPSAVNSMSVWTRPLVVTSPPWP